MLEPFLELLLELLWDCVLPLLLEGTVEAVKGRDPVPVGAGATPLGSARSGFGLLVLGAAAGWASVALLPYPVLPALSPVRGISVLLAPLATGFAMRAFGRWRVRHSGRPTFLATFGGGALLALSMALVRWLMVG